MRQTIELNDFTAVEAFGQNHTTLIIRNLHEYELRLEMDNCLADEIMEKLCKRLHGYYVEDKVSELEHELDELKAEIKNLEELLTEERLKGSVY